MSWQDDLRQLDTALAEGRISADDYRRRRDELLASATSAAQPQPQQPGPFGQPFRWEAQQPGSAPPSDATQVVGPGSAQPDATQVVGQQGKDAERTQFVRPVTPPQGVEQPQPQPQPQPMGWQANHPQAPGPGTPWGGGDMYSPIDQPPWMVQGPEVFDDSSSSSKGKRIAVIVGVVVLLLAGIGAGFYFLSGDNQAGGGGGETTSAQATTTTKPKPTDPNEILLEQIPELNAKKDADDGVLAPSDLTSKEVLSATEVQVLVDGQVEKVAWRGATKNPAFESKGAERFSVLVVPTADEAAAAALAEQLMLAQRSEGFVNVKDPLPEMPPSLAFDKRVTPDVGDYRGMYLSGKNVVLVSIGQTPLVQEAALSGSFQDQVKAVLKQFPAVQ